MNLYKKVKHELDADIKEWLLIRQDLHNVQKSAVKKVEIRPSRIKHKFRDHWINIALGEQEGKQEATDVTSLTHDTIWDIIHQHSPAYVAKEAIYTMDLKYLRLVLDIINPNVRIDEHGRTMLHIAALHGDPEKVSLLLSREANVNRRDYNGDTAVMLSLNIPRAFHQIRLISELCQHPTLKPDRQNKRGWTILHRACSLGDVTLVELVLATGCSVDILDQKQMMAIQYAKKNEDEIINLFRLSVRDTNKAQHDRMWSHIISRDFVTALIRLVEPSCIKCKRKYRDCGKMRETEYRRWIHLHRGGDKQGGGKKK